MGTEAVAGSPTSTPAFPVPWRPRLRRSRSDGDRFGTGLPADDPDWPMPKALFVAPTVIPLHRSCGQSCGHRASHNGKDNGTGNGKGGGDGDNGGNSEGDDDDDGIEK